MTRASLPADLERGIGFYALAACAAVGAAADAEAAVIYSGPQNIVLGANSPVAIDLDFNGVADYTLNRERIGSGQPVECPIPGACKKAAPEYTRTLLLLTPRPGNEFALVLGPPETTVIDAGVVIFDFPAADPASPMTMITPLERGQGFAIESYALAGAESPPTRTGGEWLGAAEKYLGLAFDIDGARHYGWLALSVSDGFDIGATIHDWAYETVAGRAIVAGARVGPDDGTIAEPGTLGLLALGSAAVAGFIRRRRASAAEGRDAAG